MRNLLLAAVVLAFVPTVRAADEENPFKKAKVGDWAEYKMTTSVGGINIDGKIKMTVTAKDDKEATLKTTATVNGMEVPGQETKIDLTKPYDPTNLGQIPKGADVKVEKDGEGKEKLKVGNKDYETNWMKLKVTTKANGIDVKADMKIWMSKDVPLSGMVKMDMNSKVMDMEFKMVMELTATGGK